MVEENSAPGLFDWTPQPRSKGPGRPPHQRTRETTIRVISLLALGAKVKEVACALRVSAPIIRREYLSDPRIRAARLVLKGELMAALIEAAAKGNVAANDKLWKRIERAALEDLSDQVADRGRKASKPKIERLGKKAEAAVKAKKVGGKFAPPPAPLLN